VHRHARERRSHSNRREEPRTAASSFARAGTPTELGTLLRLADGGTAQRLTGELQSRYGNRGVASLVGDGTRIHGLPAHVRAGYASDLVEAVTDYADALLGGGGDETELDTTTTAPTPTTSATNIVVSDTKFNVSGEFATMAADLAARTEAGSVTSQVSDIYFEPLPGPIKLANITVTETRSLPNWVDRGKPTAEQTAEWDRFFAALGTHEQTHIDIDTKAFTGIHAKCIGVKQDVADKRIDAAIEASNTANAEFDTKTDHGRNAGTKIDTNVGAGTIKVP
jgi:hypothetical protein